MGETPHCPEYYHITAPASRQVKYICTFCNFAYLAIQYQGIFCLIYPLYSPVENGMMNPYKNIHCPQQADKY